MGSCNCNQTREPDLSVNMQLHSPRYSSLHVNKVIAIQAAYRGYRARKAYRQLSLAEEGRALKAPKRSALPKHSNSTDDCSLEPKNQFGKQTIVTLNNTVSPIEEEQDLRAKSVTSSITPLTNKVRSGSFSPEDGPRDLGRMTLSIRCASPTKSPIHAKNVKFTSIKRSFQLRANCILTHEPQMRHEKLIISVQSKNHQITQSAIKLVGGNVYRGQWLNSLPHGQGKYVFADQSFYVGEFARGRFHGKGEFRSQNGCAYNGDWENNAMQGHGIYTYASGAYYEGMRVLRGLGQWLQDQPHGYGFEKYRDGSSYRGQFDQGLKHGVGIMRFADESSYEGDFQNDDMTGRGLYRWKDGRVYEGEWLNGKMSGEGVLRFPDGRSYCGQYLNDQRHGLGTFEFPDGRKYTGQWRKGMQDGEGCFFKSETEMIRGIWRKGNLVQVLEN